MGMIRNAEVPSESSEPEYVREAHFLPILN